MERTRTAKGTYQAKYDKNTILWIIEQLNKMVDVLEIHYGLAKRYGITWRASYNWIAIARNCMVDMQNGLTIDEALARDIERKKVLAKSKRGSSKNKVGKNI